MVKCGEIAVHRGLNGAYGSNYHTNHGENRTHGIKEATFAGVV
jgi:hypothetical protein